MPQSIPSWLAKDPQSYLFEVLGFVIVFWIAVQLAQIAARHVIKGLDESLLLNLGDRKKSIDDTFKDQDQALSTKYADTLYCASFHLRMARTFSGFVFVQYSLICESVIATAACLAYLGFKGMASADNHAILLASLLAGTAATSTASLYFYKLSDAVQQHSESYSIMLGLADELISVRLKKGIDLAEFVSDWDKRMLRARRLAVSFDTTRVVTTADILKQLRQGTDQQASADQPPQAAPTQQPPISSMDQQKPTATHLVEQAQPEQAAMGATNLHAQQCGVQACTGEHVAIGTARQQVGQEEVTVNPGS